MISIFKSRQFIYFLCAGGIAAIINIFTRYLLSFYFNFVISIILAYLLGMFTAYILSKKFVFINSKQSQKRSLFIFSFVNLLAIFQTLFISIIFNLILLNTFNKPILSNLISHIIGVIFPVFTSFYGHKYFSFREPR